MSAHSHRKRAGWRPRRREDLFAVPGYEKSLPEALAELAPEPELVPRGDAPAAVPEGAYPCEDIPPAGALATLDETPAWPPVAVPGGDALDSSTTVLATPSTLMTPIGDSIPAPEPEPDREPVVPDEYRVPLDSRALLYAEPGWTHSLTVARVRNGEWDDVHTLFNGTMSRAVASLTAAAWDVRDAIGEGWREICIAARRPDLIQPGWKMIRDLAAEGRRASRPQPSFTPASPQTRPQPVLREPGRAAAGRRRAA